MIGGAVAGPLISYDNGGNIGAVFFRKPGFILSDETAS
jgi:hypothetical protein